MEPAPCDADAVLIGAGTRRADTAHLWAAGFIDRARAEDHRAVGRLFCRYDLRRSGAE